MFFRCWPAVRCVVINWKGFCIETKFQIDFTDQHIEKQGGPGRWTWKWKALVTKKSGGLINLLIVLTDNICWTAGTCFNMKMEKDKRKRVNSTQRRKRWKRKWWKGEIWWEAGCDDGKQNRREDLKKKKQSSENTMGRWLWWWSPKQSCAGF